MGQLLAVVGLAALHGLVALLPGQPIALATNAVLFAANLVTLYSVRLLLRSASPTRVAMFSLGYFLLFVLVLLLLQRESLFILLAIVYAAVFHVPYLLGYFVVFVFSFIVFQPYSVETFIPLAFGWALVWRAIQQRSPTFVTVCFAGGLFFLLLVLFPLLHLSLLDSPRTLTQVIGRRDVQQAILNSVLTSSTATLLVALWGVPLAYGLARLEFRGKRVVETLIDLPILMPQSVVGVALLTLLGPGSPLGEALQRYLGIQIAGRFVGIVLAQMFVACPFLIKSAMTAFEGVPPHLEGAARTLGATPMTTFWRVSMPLASRGVLVGAILAWARAISEFGSIILFASSPLTAPILVHTEFAKAGISESRPIAVLLLMVCLWVFVLLQFGQTLLPSALRSRRSHR